MYMFVLRVQQMPMDDPIQVCRETGGEHFKKGSCKHEFCKPCLSHWIESSIDSRMVNIKCPDADCTCCMHADDISRIAGSDWRTKYNELAAASYK